MYIDTDINMASYAEVRGVKKRRNGFLFPTVSKDSLRCVLEPERKKKKDRYIMSIPSYRSCYERWNFSVNLEELGAGEISYLYKDEPVWLGSIYIVSV